MSALKLVDAIREAKEAVEKFNEALEGESADAELDAALWVSDATQRVIRAYEAECASTATKSK